MKYIFTMVWDFEADDDIAAKKQALTLIPQELSQEPSELQLRAIYANKQPRRVALIRSPAEQNKISSVPKTSLFKRFFKSFKLRYNSKNYGFNDI